MSSDVENAPPENNAFLTPTSRKKPTNARTSVTRSARILSIASPMALTSPTSLTPGGRAVREATRQLTRISLTTSRLSTPIRKFTTSKVPKLSSAPLPMSFSMVEEQGPSLPITIVDDRNIPQIMTEILHSLDFVHSEKGVPWSGFKRPDVKTPKASKRTMQTEDAVLLTPYSATEKMPMRMSLPSSPPPFSDEEDKENDPPEEQSDQRVLRSAAKPKTNSKTIQEDDWIATPNGALSPTEFDNGNILTEEFQWQSAMPSVKKARVQLQQIAAEANPSTPLSKKRKRSSPEVDHVEESSSEEESDENISGEELRQDEFAHYFQNKLDRSIQAKPGSTSLENNKSSTSDHTMRHLCTDLTWNQYRKQVLSQPLETAEHRQSRQQLYQWHRRTYSQWITLMIQGFHILCYGFGSKRSLLMDFAKSWLRLKHKLRAVVVCEGFSPTLTVRNILQQCRVAQGADAVEAAATATMSNVKAVQEQPKSPHWLILVHSLDAPVWRDYRMRDLLLELLLLPNVYCLASIDHLNAPLLWCIGDESRSSVTNAPTTRGSAAKWLWHDVTTFEPFVQEHLCDDASLTMRLVGQSSVLSSQGQLLGRGALCLTAAKHVLGALTENARRVFLILAKHQLDALSSATSEQEQEKLALDAALTFDSYYRTCRDSFLVSTEPAFRTLLTELCDHVLVKRLEMSSSETAIGGAQSAVNSAELLFVPMVKETLEALVEDLEATAS